MDRTGAVLDLSVDEFGRQLQKQILHAFDTDVLRAIKPLLAHGIATDQGLMGKGPASLLTTRLISSGEPIIRIAEGRHDDSVRPFNNTMEYSSYWTTDPFVGCGCPIPHEENGPVVIPEYGWRVQAIGEGN